MTLQPVQVYDRQWRELGDFIRYNPGGRHRRRLVLDLLRRQEFSSLLDVGCGPAEMLLFLARRLPSHVQLTGVDFAPDVIERNRREFPDLRFAVLDIERGALPDQFDVVVCSEVIEHLEHQREAIRHLSSMVKPGGALLITCPTGPIFKTEQYFGHVRHPLPVDLDRWTGENGLRLEALSNWGWPFYASFKMATNLGSRWALKQFGRGRYSRTKILVNHVVYAVNLFNLPSCPWGCQLLGLFRRPAETAPKAHG
jgi:SAM-dependent methyltransferase